MRKNKAVYDISYPSNRKGFIYALARRESPADLNKDDLVNREALHKINKRGYIGLFQYGKEALIDIGYNTEEGSWTGKNGAVSEEAFRSSREIQIAAINLTIDLWCKRLRVWGFNEYYGKIVKGIEITESGCIAGCHLVGSGGLASFLDMPGNYKINKKTGKRHSEFDGNKTHISEYLDLFAGYDLETCCKRKIRVKLQDADGLVLKDKTVKIFSSYNGKHLNSKFEVTHKTDKDGELPVIVRHPDAEIILEIDGRKSETISQKADQVQPYKIIASDMKVSAPLAAKGTPEPKKQDEMEQQPQQPSSDAENNASKDVNFHLSLLEGDTKKPISNVKFTLVYKGKPKQHITNTQGIKENIIAEIGQTIQICMAGEGNLQPIKSFTVTESLRDTVVKVSLPVHTFTITVVDTKGKAVSNTEFSIFYRQREKSKKTDHEGRLKVKALVGFVYGFGNKGKPLLHLRCLQSVSIRQITVDQKAIQNAQGALGTNSITAMAQVMQQAAFNTIGQVLKNNPLQKQPTTTQKTPPPKQEEKPQPQPQQKEPPRQKNIHTEQGGKPLTVVGDQKAAKDTVRYHIYHDGTIKRENKNATGFVEFIYHDKNKKSHYIQKFKLFRVPKRRAGNDIIPNQYVYLLSHKEHAKDKSPTESTFSYAAKDNSIGCTWIISSDSKRFYFNPNVMAGILGTLITYGSEEVNGILTYISSGASASDGHSPSPSKTHRNGEACDLRYLPKGLKSKLSQKVYTTYPIFDLAANTKWVAVFKRFGFRTFYTGTQAVGGVAAIAGTSFSKNHHHHLHIGNHNGKIQDI